MYLDEPFCVHEWKCEHTGERPCTVHFKHSIEGCHEIVEEFASYLAGCGFYQNNIIEAFEDYVVANKKAIVNGALRLQKSMVEESE